MTDRPPIKVQGLRRLREWFEAQTPDEQERIRANLLAQAEAPPANRAQRRAKKKRR